MAPQVSNLLTRLAIASCGRLAALVRDFVLSDFVQTLVGVHAVARAEGVLVGPGCDFQTSRAVDGHREGMHHY